MAVLTPLRARALSTLQALRDRRDPSMLEWDVADRAIDLALSPRRPEGPFLVHDCLRNARSIALVARGRARARGIAPGTTGAAEAVELAEDDVPGQFDSLAWSETYRGFAGAVRALHPAAERVLFGLEAGEPVDATAAAVDMSERSVKSLRASIRAMSGAALAAGRA